MNVIRLINETVSDFTMETGKQPRYLYLGTEEFEELRQASLLLCSKLDPLAYTRSFDGMSIIECNISSHLRCS